MNNEPVFFYRTPFQCYRQAMKLEVDLLFTGQCERPKKAEQTLISGVNDKLSCPLREYIDKLNSYNVTTSLMWYRVSYEKSLLSTVIKY